jgi:tripartite-type tricarboxylate transporter receptor subunit TctC
VLLVGTAPYVIAANADLPYKNFADVIAAAKAKPGSVKYASVGIGTLGHLAMTVLGKKAGVEITHVPYRGGSPQFINDMIAGHVDMSLTPLGNGTPYVRDGKLKLLAVLSNARLPEFPDAPAISEVLPGLETYGWTGIAAPPRTPRDVTDKLSQAVARVLGMTDVRERILAMQAIPVGNTPDQMRRVIEADTKRWAPVIRAAKISID